MTKFIPTRLVLFLLFAFLSFFTVNISADSSQPSTTPPTIELKVPFAEKDMDNVWHFESISKEQVFYKAQEHYSDYYSTHEEPSLFHKQVMLIDNHFIEISYYDLISDTPFDAEGKEYKIIKNDC